MKKLSCYQLGTYEIFEISRALVVESLGIKFIHEKILGLFINFRHDLLLIIEIFIF